MVDGRNYGNSNLLGLSEKAVITRHTSRRRIASPGPDRSGIPGYVSASGRIVDF